MMKEFLRRSQLFSNLSESDLDWLSAQTEPITVRAGENLIEEGRPGDAAYIVVDGEFEVVKKSDVQNIVIAVREPGEVIGEMALLDQAPRMATVRALRESKALRIRGDTFQEMLSHSSAATLSILQTVSKRLRQNEGLLRQNEKMAALGTLAAGLAHELNNPAAAVSRSSDQLRLALRKWSLSAAQLGGLGLDELQNKRLKTLEADLEIRPRALVDLDPLARSGRDSEVQAWLEEKGVSEAWELSPALVSFGWELGTLMELEDAFPPSSLPAVLSWLGNGCSVYSLLGEVRAGTERISEIVQSVKAYSYLDQAPVQEVDVREGLENTLLILKHKLKDRIKVNRSYAGGLPLIESYGSELNQVWTNIIDNAIDAMGEGGELTVRTSLEAGNVLVEIEDNGPGIPAEIRQRIFEPFFTTKPPGQGTGLGLHIAYTIVNNHYGQIQVESERGRTCFRVRLPIQLPR